MFFLYSILYTIGFVLMLPFFLLNRKKYASGFKQRFGFLPEFHYDGRPVMWLHCVSVGETNAARPLVEKILSNYPNYRLIVSTTTKTGQELAKKLFAENADLVFYFPFDWKFTVNRVLKKLNPSVILIMETELWLNFLRESHRRGSRIFVINGRISERSYKGYKRFRKTIGRVLNYLDLALVQTAEDAKRLLRLGIRKNKLKITGNFKFDQKKERDEKQLTAYFRERFELKKESPLIVAASTHSPEEKWLIEAFEKVYKSDVGNLPRLMLVPRHPERFDEVEELLQKTSFKWVKRTSPLSLDDGTADIILLDSIGELRSVMPLAEIVFVGGSLIPHGGQNILEPALEKKTIVTGNYMMNFSAMAQEFTEREAFIQLPKLKEDAIPVKLAEVFTELLEDEKLKNKLAANAFKVMQKNRGATGKTLNFLKPFLQVQSNVVRQN